MPSVQDAESISVVLRDHSVDMVEAWTRKQAARFLDIAPSMKADVKTRHKIHDRHRDMEGVEIECGLVQLFQSEFLNGKSAGS